MTRFNQGWYLMYTRPKHEKKVAESLKDTGIEYYLPLIKELRNWCDRRKYIDMPLFPSYVFVFLKDMKDYYEGLNTDGFLYYVKFENKVVRVSDAIIENIRLLISKGTDIEVTAEHFRPGQQLVIYEGPFTGMNCEIVHVNGKEKVLVRVHLIQRNLLATLPVQALKSQGNLTTGA